MNAKATALTEKECALLRRARDLCDEVERLQQDVLEAQLQTVSSPNMDGMPHGSSTGDAIPRQIVRKDNLADKLKGAERALERTRAEARKALAGVKAPLRMFCEVYFLEAGTLEAACIYARVDKRTGERYRAYVNRM